MIGKLHFEVYIMLLVVGIGVVRKGDAKYRESTTQQIMGMVFSDVARMSSTFVSVSSDQPLVKANSRSR